MYNLADKANEMMHTFEESLDNKDLLKTKEEFDKISKTIQDFQNGVAQVEQYLLNRMELLSKLCQAKATEEALHASAAPVTGPSDNSMPKQKQQGHATNHSEMRYKVVENLLYITGLQGSKWQFTDGKMAEVSCPLELTRLINNSNNQKAKDWIRENPTGVPAQLLKLDKEAAAKAAEEAAAKAAAEAAVDAEVIPTFRPCHATPTFVNLEPLGETKNASFAAAQKTDADCAAQRKRKPSQSYDTTCEQELTTQLKYTRRKGQDGRVIHLWTFNGKQIRSLKQLKAQVAASDDKETKAYLAQHPDSRVVHDTQRTATMLDAITETVNDFLQKEESSEEKESEPVAHCFTCDAELRVAVHYDSQLHGHVSDWNKGYTKSGALCKFTNTHPACSMCSACLECEH
jgi:hypothetical protein